MGKHTKENREKKKQREKLQFWSVKASFVAGFIVIITIFKDLYKLKLSGGDIKAVQGDSGHAQADMVTEVYGHILDEDRKKNAQLIEDAFYKKENLNPDMKRTDTGKKKIEVPDGIDAEALMKVLNNPEMAALLAGLAKGVTV